MTPFISRVKSYYWHEVFMPWRILSVGKKAPPLSKRVEALDNEDGQLALEYLKEDDEFVKHVVPNIVSVVAVYLLVLSLIGFFLNL